MISHEEAQELHEILGNAVELEEAQGQAYGEELERAREIAALIVSDTDPDNQPPKPLPGALVHPDLWPEVVGTLYGAILKDGQITTAEWNQIITAHAELHPGRTSTRRVQAIAQP